MRFLLCVLLTTVALVQRSDAAPVRAIRSDHFVEHIGINTHFGYTDLPYFTQYAQVKQKLGALGIRYIRDGAWPESWRRRTDITADLGIRFLFPIGGWNDMLTSQLADQRLADIKQYWVSTILAIEGVNEYDNSGRANYAAEVRAFTDTLYQKIKNDQILSRVTMVGPSIAYGGGYSAVGNISAFVDVGCMHWYPSDKEPSNRDFNYFDWHLDQAQTNLYPGKDLWLTETGYNTRSVDSGGISEAAEAKYLPRVFMWMLYQRGMQRAFSYELVDEPTNGSYNERYFGIIRGDLTEKPAYGSLKNCIALLRDPDTSFTPGTLDYSLTGDTAKIVQVLFQKKSGDFLLVLWQEVRCFNLDTRTDIVNADRAMTLRLGAPASTVHVFRPAPAQIGNGLTPIATYESTSSVTLQVPDQVLVVELLTNTTAVHRRPAPASALARSGGPERVAWYDLRGNRIGEAASATMAIRTDGAAPSRRRIVGQSIRVVNRGILVASGKSILEMRGSR